MGVLVNLNCLTCWTSWTVIGFDMILIVLGIFVCTCSKSSQQLVWDLLNFIGGVISVENEDYKKANSNLTDLIAGTIIAWSRKNILHFTELILKTKVQAYIHILQYLRYDVE